MATVLSQYIPPLGSVRIQCCNKDALLLVEIGVYSLTLTLSLVRLGFTRTTPKMMTVPQMLLVQLWIAAKLLKVMSPLVLSLYMGVTGLVCSHFLMLGKAPTIATRAHRAGHPVKSLSSIRAFGWFGWGTFNRLTNW